MSYTQQRSARAIAAYFQVAPSNHEDWQEVYTALVSHRRLQRMPSNGGEFSWWLDQLALISRRV